MSLHSFWPKYEHHGNIGIDNDTVCKFKSNIDTIKNEPMLWQSDYIFAYKNGGPLTRKCLDFLRPIVECPEGRNIVIDTRVNMLMKGFYPSIPDWHCDWVERGKNGQPDLNKLDRLAQNYCCVISDKEDVSGTEFITNKLLVTYDKDNVWRSISEGVEFYKKRNAADVTSSKLKSGDMLKFNQEALHRATPAKCNGWRFFFRLSCVKVEPKNEIRNQTQIYVKEGGW